MRYYYDLHIHSCLSPCGDDESTPNNIVNMGFLNGLNVMALTDHNSCKNCPAFISAARNRGIVAIPGMELTTSEDIHIVCLFKNLNDALSFDSVIENRIIPFKNRVDIFGQQMIMNKDDEVIAVVDNLLSNATTVSVDEVVKLVNVHNGICYPAHIDRQANGIISILGFLPETPVFTAVEFHDKGQVDEYNTKYGLSHSTVVSSDAHYIWDISDADNYFEMDEQLTDSQVIDKIFEILG